MCRYYITVGGPVPAPAVPEGTAPETLGRDHRVPRTVAEAARCHGEDRRHSSSSSSSPVSEPLLCNGSDDSGPASGVPRLSPTDTQLAQCIHADSSVVCSSRRAAAGLSATEGGAACEDPGAFSPAPRGDEPTPFCQRPRRGGAGPSPPWNGAETHPRKPVDSKSENTVAES